MRFTDDLKRKIFKETTKSELFEEVSLYRRENQELRSKISLLEQEKEELSKKVPEKKKNKPGQGRKKSDFLRHQDSIEYLMIESPGLSASKIHALLRGKGLSISLTHVKNVMKRVKETQRREKEREDKSGKVSFVSQDFVFLVNSAKVNMIVDVTSFSKSFSYLCFRRREGKYYFQLFGKQGKGRDKKNIQKESKEYVHLSRCKNELLKYYDRSRKKAKIEALGKKDQNQSTSQEVKKN